MTKPAAESILAALAVAKGAIITGARRIPLNPATPPAGDPIQFGEILAELNGECGRHAVWRDVLRSDLETAEPEKIADLKIAIAQRARLAAGYELAVRIIETCRVDPVIRRRMKEIEREKAAAATESLDGEESND